MRESLFRGWFLLLGMLALMTSCAHAPSVGPDEDLVRYKVPYLVVGEDFVQVGLEILRTFGLSSRELDSRTLNSAERITPLLRQGMIDGVGSDERSDFDMRLEIRVTPKAPWWLQKSVLIAAEKAGLRRSPSNPFVQQTCRPSRKPIDVPATCFGMDIDSGKARKCADKTRKKYNEIKLVVAGEAEMRAADILWWPSFIQKVWNRPKEYDSACVWLITKSLDQNFYEKQCSLHHMGQERQFAPGR